MRKERTVPEAMHESGGCVCEKRLTYPQVQKNDGSTGKIWATLDDITPFGRTFLKADTYSAVQECYLRAMSVEQFPMPDGKQHFLR